MIKIAVQEFLRAGGQLSELESKYSIHVKRHKQYNNLVLLKYSIDSPMGEEIVQDCRGIILDENDNWKIVCFPYRKFFNYGEGFAAKIDVNTMKVYEKLDGSLMTLYFYDNRWHVASSGTPDASGNINESDKSFADLFWDTWRALNYKLPIDRNICYMFELMTNNNRIVVNHPKSRLVLHGLRWVDENQPNLSGCELPPAKAYNNIFNWEVVNVYDFHTVEEIIEFAKSINPVEMEGFVVRDANWNRLKIKAPDYIKLHHCKDNLNSFKNLVGLVLSNESSEFLTYFPELKESYEKVTWIVDRIRADIDLNYAAFKHIEIQKDFALAIKDYPYKAALFAMRKGAISNGLKWLRMLPLDKSVELIKARLKA